MCSLLCQAGGSGKSADGREEGGGRTAEGRERGPGAGVRQQATAVPGYLGRPRPVQRLTEPGSSPRPPHQGRSLHMFICPSGHTHISTLATYPPTLFAFIYCSSFSKILQLTMWSTFNC